MESKKISVWLDDDSEDQLKKFRCPMCGKVVFEYYSSIRIIMPGEMEGAKKSPIVVQCNGAITEYVNGTAVNRHCHTKLWVE